MPSEVDKVCMLVWDFTKKFRRLLCLRILYKLGWLGCGVLLPLWTDDGSYSSLCNSLHSTCHHYYTSQLCTVMDSLQTILLAVDVGCMFACRTPSLTCRLEEEILISTYDKYCHSEVLHCSSWDIHAMFMFRFLSPPATDCNRHLTDWSHGSQLGSLTWIAKLIQTQALPDTRKAVESAVPVQRKLLRSKNLPSGRVSICLFLWRWRTRLCEHLSLWCSCAWIQKASEHFLACSQWWPHPPSQLGQGRRSCHLQYLHSEKRRNWKGGFCSKFQAKSSIHWPCALLLVEDL